MSNGGYAFTATAPTTVSTSTNSTHAAAKATISSSTIATSLPTVASFTSSATTLPMLDSMDVKAEPHDVEITLEETPKRVVHGSSWTPLSYRLPKAACPEPVKLVIFRPSETLSNNAANTQPTVAVKRVQMAPRSVGRNIKSESSLVEVVRHPTISVSSQSHLIIKGSGTEHPLPGRIARERLTVPDIISPHADITNTRNIMVGSAHKSILKSTFQLLNKKASSMSVADRLVEVCDIFGGKLKVNDGRMYVHCRNALQLFPRLKWTCPLEMIAAAKQMLDCYIGADPTLTKLRCFDMNVDGDVWLSAKTYLVLLIRAYDVITGIPQKPRIRKLTNLYSQLYNESATFVKASSTTQVLPPQSIKGSATSAPCIPTCHISTQTNGGIHPSYIKGLPLKKQLSHPSIIKKVAWIIQHDRSLNEVFWQAYNTNSYNTINRVPDILKGDNRMVVDSYAQTEGACVPVLKLKRLRLDPQANTFSLNAADKVTVDSSGSSQQMCLDFVPNNGSADQMDVLFQNINIKNSRMDSMPQLSDLVDASNSELQFFDEPEVSTEVQSVVPLQPTFTATRSTRVRKPVVFPDCHVEDMPDKAAVGNEKDSDWSGADESEAVCSSDTNSHNSDGSDIFPADVVDRKREENSKLTARLRGSKRRAKVKVGKKIVKPVIDRARRCLICHREFQSTKMRRCCENCRVKRDKGRYSFLYCCPQCPYKGKLVVQVANHIQMVHNGKRSAFTCDVCGEQFTQKTHLKKHQIIHAANKPLMCETCGRGFTQRTNLKAHMRQHTGEKPFQCEHCGQSFTHNVSLRKHFCETLGRRIEPLDHKIPNVGRRPAKRKACNTNVVDTEVRGTSKRLPRTVQAAAGKPTEDDSFLELLERMA